MNILKKRLSSFELKDVSLYGYEADCFKLEIKYLLSLNENRLLRGFCDIAEISCDSPLYGGWETSAIQGHTMGHYLTALSQAYASAGDVRLLTKIRRILSVLGKCQNKESGYLAAIPEEHYIKLEKGDISDTWVPWYSMHKILSGLISAYELTSEADALEIASRLGDWVYSRTSAWTPEIQKTVLNIEYGGMNDCLYRLYSHTKSPNHLSAAHAFDELPLFEALYRNEDILDGKHANTTIPKFLGALRRYLVLGKGEEFYLEAAANFWNTVTENHTYATGGNSEWEHFGKSRILDAERTECNCETCNTYNMLKLTRELFAVTGDKKYADYYETAFINAILSSQNPETGMTTYFQPMATGFFKVYSTPFDHFWCCTGSGMESFTKLGDSIYFKDSSSVYVLRYTDSEVNIDGSFCLKQKFTDGLTPSVKLTVYGNADKDILLRVPHWCTKAPVITLNGETSVYSESNGFIRLSASWNDGDEINCQFFTEIKIHRMPDNENAVAFSYGQYLLSADLGKSNMNTGVTGVNVTIPLADKNESGEILIEGCIEDWLKNISDNLIPVDGNLEFELKNADRKLIFTPHFRQHKNRYGIYFRIKN
ncbi:MAG: hypothetical protein E7544_08250 [Ruminococcaceae bacterium]|nr:hypothetical protein [Oscillospiraceae bacterium]